MVFVGNIILWLSDMSVEFDREEGETIQFIVSSVDCATVVMTSELGFNMSFFSVSSFFVCVVRNCTSSAIMMFLILGSL